MAHPSTELLEHTPRYLRSESLLERVQAIATAELEHAVISSIVPQSTEHLMFTCKRIVPGVDGKTDGKAIWFAFSLIHYMSREKRLHLLLEQYRVTEFDFAVAESLLNYARRLVGSRSREQIARVGGEAKPEATVGMAACDLWKASSTTTTEADVGALLLSESDSSDDESETSTVLTHSPKSRTCDLGDMAMATQLACSLELARKTRRGDALASPTACETPLCGAPRVKSTLEFLHLFFLQDLGFLTHLLSESPETSRDAARKVLQWQLESRHLAFEVGTSEQFDALFEAAACAAQGTRAMLLPLIEQPRDRSPTIVSWVDNTHTTPRVFTGLAHAPKTNALGMQNTSTRFGVCAIEPFAQPAEAMATTIVWSPRVRRR